VMDVPVEDRNPLHARRSRRRRRGRHLEGTARARLGHGSGVSRVYLGCISGASRVYLGCISGVSRVHLGCISGVSRVYLGCISGVSRMCLGHISGHLSGVEAATISPRISPHLPHISPTSPHISRRVVEASALGEAALEAVARRVVPWRPHLHACRGHVSDMSRTCLGHVSDVRSHLHGGCCRGRVADVSWTCRCPGSRTNANARRGPPGATAARAASTTAPVHGWRCEEVPTHSGR